MEFNRNRPQIIHLDINSCFATIEQQANPSLRDKPVAVAAYLTNSGCILAASVTAKKIGIKTGMRVMDAKLIYPNLVVLLPDPAKYRFVHLKIHKILKDYSEEVRPKSIDEFVLTLVRKDIKAVCLEIKQRIKDEVGEYITVSIGVSTNGYLAKVASNLKKPDGLSFITKNNFCNVFEKLKLTDLTGIKKGNSNRLRLYGIKTVLDFYNSPVWLLRLAFGGITGLYWYRRMHGYEVDNFKSIRKTYGNSYAPPANKAHLKLQILTKLCEKTGFRLRKANLMASGIHLSLAFKDGSYWHKGCKTKRVIYESSDIYKEAVRLLNESPQDLLPRVIAVNVFNLKSKDKLQLQFFDDEIKKSCLTEAVDSINEKWGIFTIHSARVVNDSTVVQDRISFGQL